MKFVITADIHLSQYSQDPIQENNLPERLNSIYKTLNNILLDCRKLEIKDLIIAGDTLNDKSVIYCNAQSLLLDLIRNNLDIHFIIIDGNHDMSSMSKGSGLSSLKSLDNEINVTMIHETKTIDKIDFVPWGKSMVDDIKNSKSDYIISHLGVNEAELSNGMSTQADIKASDFSRFKKVILGHYHKPQTLNNIWYVGSPIQLNWGEKNEEKRYLILDTTNDTIVSVPTNGYKKHIELLMTNETKDEITKLAKQHKDNGDHVAIKFFEKIDLEDDIDDEIRLIDKSEYDISNRGIDRSMSTFDKLTKYVDLKEIPDEQKKKYVDLAIELIDSLKEEG